MLKNVNQNHIIASKEKKYVSNSQKIPYYPVAFQKGKGALLYDYENREYIDFLSSASSANIGHGNKEIAKVVKEQMENLAQYTLAYFYAREPVELARKLISVAPGDDNKKVMFSTTGSASIDGAIKLARAYTGRSKIISFCESYHGSTYGALSISAINTNMRKNIGPLLPEVYHFNYPNCIRCRYGKKEKSCKKECLKDIEYAFNYYLPAEEVAAVFIEPIAGDAGLIVPPKRYMKALHELCKKNGILFISDEIQQGVGRTGKWFGIEHFDIEPDLIVLGKSIGGGLPLGIVIGKSDIMDSLDAPGHLFSMTGNSTVCAAALKMIEIFEREDLNTRAYEMGEYIKNRFLELKEKYEIIGDVRGVGMSIAVDLVKNRNTMEKNYEAAAKICYRCIERGLILIFIGQSVLRVQPPIVITKEQVDKALDIVEKSINEYLNGQIGEEVFKITKGW
ncbi:aminotransferase class III-fold pyridoxal phosphate-dependent enzyme [Clostridiisalibacter paucivorans]|uniref:aminotransferase class III-fold pyridoxal phosphate-dependent enzyme n=1 Tax=Clostridiisalibacter paucivorans TaxID=408753 RepID=UPI00047CD3E1|nr:aminotransferase class III-fold pyridoxal phosphate-dependent enzyme [Clostridiisalibacter paucivorans]